MTDDYLFDPNLPPDPEIEKIEDALRRFRRQPRTHRIPVSLARRVAPYAAAALVIASLLMWINHDASPGEHPGRATNVSEPPSGFRLSESSGDVRLDSGATAHGGAATDVRVGDRISVGDGASARLEVGTIGSLTVESGSRLRIDARTAGSDADYSVFLERGTIAARILARPRTFQVGTPSGIAVDLGCIYRTTVTDDGHTLLDVTTGRVSFESEGRRVFVPAGAGCRATPGRGPGTPVWKSAPMALRTAVETLDATGGTDAAALNQVCATESRDDTLTLFHLLDLRDAAARERIYDRLAKLSPPPVGVTRVAILAGDRAQLDRWREALRVWW